VELYRNAVYRSVRCGDRNELTCEVNLSSQSHGDSGDDNDNDEVNAKSLATHSTG
jgi:hypothetical protein